MQLPGRRPGRHGAHQVSAQRPPHPPDVLRPPGPHVRAQGVRRGRRRRAHHAAATRANATTSSRTTRRSGASAAAADVSRRWASSRRASSSCGPARPKAQRLAEEIDQIVEEIARSGRCTGARRRRHRRTDARDPAEVELPTPRRWSCGGDGMTATEAQIRHVLGGSVRRLRDRRPEHPREDPRRRRQLRRRLLAGGDGCQVPRRGGDAGRLHHADASSTAPSATTRTLEMASLLRRKSKILVAFGSCAVEGCIPGLANLSTVERHHRHGVQHHHHRQPARPPAAAQLAAPEGELHIPTLAPVVRTLDQVVPVDYFMPGCPPECTRSPAVVDLVVAALAGPGRAAAGRDRHRRRQHHGLRRVQPHSAT